MTLKDKQKDKKLNKNPLSHTGIWKKNRGDKGIQINVIFKKIVSMVQVGNTDTKRKGAEKGRCPLCNKEENVVHIFLKCNEVQRWREKLLDNKWLYINEYIAHNSNQLKN